MDLGDCGVDVFDPGLSCQGDSMVTVRHEVGLVDLEHRDRWEISIGVGLSYSGHPVTEVGAERVEAAVEIAAPTDGSRDVVDRDGTYPEGGLLDKTQGLLDVIEVEQHPAGPVVGECDH